MGAHEERLTKRRVVEIVSRYLGGERDFIEPIVLDSAITGLRKIYITPTGAWRGRGILETPRVLEARLVIPGARRNFGRVAVKDYKTAIRENDAPTLLPPTIAHARLRENGVENTERKLAVQMWMDEPTAEEYLLEVAKVRHAWKHLVRKRRENVIISDLAPQNVKKWVVDADVYRKDVAKEWKRISLQEFLDKYGEDGVNAVIKLARIAKLKEDDVKEIERDLRYGKMSDRAADVLEKMLEIMPKTKYFWEHHVNKDLDILRNVQRAGRIPYRRLQSIRRMAEWLRRHGHEQYPDSLLNLLELERNIVAEWISAYKRKLKEASAK